MDLHCKSKQHLRNKDKRKESSDAPLKRQNSIGDNFDHAKKVKVDKKA